MSFDRLRRRLVDYHDPDSLSSRIRQRRLHVVRALVEQAARQGGDTILDVGGTVEYWRLVGFDVLRRSGMRVTLLNLGSLGIPADAADVLETRIGDGCDLSCFAGRSFALAISNSVIEHVGPWPAMQAFANEIRRVARAYYVQTPNYWFPVELHYVMPFIHWLPGRSGAVLLRRLRGPNASLAEIRLLDRRRMRQLFPDAEQHTEWFAGLPKSLIAIRTEPR